MLEIFRPLLEAWRDAAIAHAPETIATIAVAFSGLVVALIAAFKKLALAKLEQLQLAALAGVHVAHAQAAPAPAVELDGETKKKIADFAAEALLKAVVPKVAASKAIAALPEAVQAAYDSDRARSSSPTVPETPSAIAASKD